MITIPTEESLWWESFFSVSSAGFIEMKRDVNWILSKTTVMPDKVQELLECMGLEYVEDDNICYSWELDGN